MDNKIYETPKSEILDEADIVPQKPGITLKTLLVLFTLLSISITFLNSFVSMTLLSSLPQGSTISYSIGGAITPVWFACIFVGLFQLGKGFRNTRSRYKIFLWCQILFFLSGVSNFVKSIAQGMAI